MIPYTSKPKPNIRMGRTWRSSKWCQANSSGSLSIGTGEDPVREIDISGYFGRRPVVHDDALPTAPKILVVGLENVVHAQTSEGVEVPDLILAVVGEGGNLP